MLETSVEDHPVHRHSEAIRRLETVREVLALIIRDPVPDYTREASAEIRNWFRPGFFPAPVPENFEQRVAEMHRQLLNDQRLVLFREALEGYMGEEQGTRRKPPLSQAITTGVRNLLKEQHRRIKNPESADEIQVIVCAAMFIEQGFRRALEGELSTRRTACGIL